MTTQRYRCPIREHDLPVAWDGGTITWSPWEQELPVTICPPPRPTPCPTCKRVPQRPRLLSKGLLPVGTTLYAYRCPERRWDGTPCRHDTIVNLHTGQSWDLEVIDYGPDGSWPEDPTLFRFGDM